MGFLLIVLTGWVIGSGVGALDTRRRLDRLRGEELVPLGEIAATINALYRRVGVFAIALGGVLTACSGSLSPTLSGGVLIGVGIVAWLRPVLVRSRPRSAFASLSAATRR